MLSLLDEIQFVLDSDLRIVIIIHNIHKLSGRSTSVVYCSVLGTVTLLSEWKQTSSKSEKLTVLLPSWNGPTTGSRTLPSAKMARVEWRLDAKTSVIHRRPL